MTIQRQAFVYRLREQPGTARELSRFAGCCRCVWNTALALQQRYYRRYGTHLGYLRLANRLPRWKRRQPFLAEAPSQALQQTLKDLDTAWQRFFREPGRIGVPRFKTRRSQAAFRLPQGVKLDAGNARIFLPKAGWVRLRLSRPVRGTIKNVTVTRRDTGWHVAIQTEFAAVIEPRVGTAGGVDVGAVQSATASNGAVLDLESRLKRYLRRIDRQQRALARKTKGSKRRGRARHKLARTYDRVARVREDAVHRYSSELVAAYAVISIEDLRIAAMTAAGGSRKARLNQRILNAGWGALRTQVAYKAAASGGLAVVVDPAYTSQACNACGHVERANRRSQAEFVCRACGHAAHADANAARNIRDRGVESLLRAGTLARAPGGTGAEGRYVMLRPSSCVEGAGVGRPLKRKPAEASQAAKAA